MKALFCGDIVGRPGREVLLAALPRLRRALDLDFVVANGENAAGGFGITPAICADLLGGGVDAITTGNHAWDQREIIPHFNRESRLLRPHNYPPGTPGVGARLYTTDGGLSVLVVNLMLRLFMDPIDDPFQCVDRVLDGHKLGHTVNAILVDAHGEATSEKQALAHMLDGRVSLVVGTHTHVPTADTRILDGGTGYQTDAGMCGDYDSVIGGDKTLWVKRFKSRLPVGRIQPTRGAGTFCGVYVETDRQTGLARHVAPIIQGVHLHERLPS